MYRPIFKHAAAVSFTFLASFTLALASAQSNPEAVGIFEGHADVGRVLHEGSVHLDSTKEIYTVTGSGENMWFGTDEFHFAWRKMSGDVSISSDISFVGDKGDGHRKAVLMIRQTLDESSPFVAIARHGDGLTSLQFRDASGANTHEVQSNISAPLRLRLEKRGDVFYAFVSGPDGVLHPAGASTKLALKGPFYLGIGVCAHNKDDQQTAIFSKVRVSQLSSQSGSNPVLYSTIEIVPVASGDRRVAYVAPLHFEAPNWSRNGAYLVFNQEGGIYQLTLGSDKPKRIPTGALTKCNNDHGVSPDGATIAVSDSSQIGKSLVYTLPIAGGTPRQITTNGPSYWHGWSPDGSTLAFTGQRGDNFDIYTVSVNGGEERRLTTAAGLDDGPEYSPDGAWITGTPIVLSSFDNGTTAEALWANNAPFAQRPELVPGQKAKIANQSYRQWFNPIAFAKPASFVIGNAPRTLDTVNNPSYEDLDAALEKNTRFGERYNVQLRFEMFNALNHPDLSGPNTNLTSGQFGQITGYANSQRLIQVAGKFVF